MRHKRCYWCKRHLQHPQSRSDLALTRDHVKPRAAGGIAKVLCCFRCNQLKADMMPDQWREVMRTFPDWYVRFRTHRELTDAMSAAFWRNYRT